MAYGIQKDPVTAGVTAFAGGGQASATLLTTSFSRITTCATVGDSVKLPKAVAGLVMTVTNDGAAQADLFPLSGDAFDAQAANVAVRIGVGQTQVFECKVAGTWVSLGRPALPDAKYTKNTTVGATTAAAGDLTGAKFVSAEYSAVGAANLATRTATQMFNDTPGARIGDSYVLMVTNTSAGTTTITAGANVTLTGTMTLATNTTRTFIVTLTSATAATIQSIGVGTIS